MSGCLIIGDAKCDHHLLMLSQSLLSTNHFALLVTTFNDFPQTSYWSPCYLASYLRSSTSESNLLFQSPAAFFDTCSMSQCHCQTVFGWVLISTHAWKNYQRPWKRTSRRISVTILWACILSPEERREDRNKSWRNNARKLPKFDENYKPTYLRSSMKHKVNIKNKKTTKNQKPHQGIS